MDQVNHRIPAVDLFAIVLGMSESWVSAAPALRPATAEPDAPETEHRAALAEAARPLVAWFWLVARL